MIVRHAAVALLFAFVAASAEGQATPEPPATPATPVPRRPATAPRAPGAPVPSATPIPATAPAPPSPVTPSGWFGFSMRCNECGWTRSRPEDLPRWESTEPPEISRIAPGGPADIAGFRTGDLITHIDGVSILVRDGGRRFGAVKPGQRLRLTVIRDGVPITREVVLSERPLPIAGRSSLRYTGRLRGVDVEVWSPAGATVQRDGDILTINVGGSTIRLKAATPTPQPGR